MIKEAMQYFAESIRPPTFKDQDGIERSTDTLFPVGEAKCIHNPIKCSSLESLGLIPILTSTEGPPMMEVSPSEVIIFEINEYDGQPKKETVAICSAILPESFPWGRFLDIETFIIKASDAFERNENFNALIASISKITDVNEASFCDDGISQSVKTKAAVGVENKETKSFIPLRAFRTFREIRQPEATYLLRIQKGAQGAPTVALFEASGYQWKIEAIDSIASYLKGMIPGVIVFK